jgi:hypothetical protein
VLTAWQQQMELLLLELLLLTLLLLAQPLLAQVCWVGQGQGVVVQAVGLGALQIYKLQQQLYQALSCLKDCAAALSLT